MSTQMPSVLSLGLTRYVRLVHRYHYRSVIMQIRIPTNNIFLYLFFLLNSFIFLCYSYSYTRFGGKPFFLPSLLNFIYIVYLYTYLFFIFSYLPSPFHPLSFIFVRIHRALAVYTRLACYVLTRPMQFTFRGFLT